MFEKIGPLCLSDGIAFSLSDLLRYMELYLISWYQSPDKPLVDQDKYGQETCSWKDILLLALGDSCKRNIPHILE